MPPTPPRNIPSFNRLGPFYRLQLRLGLLTETDLAVGRRALLFTALTWGPVLALALVEGLALHPNHQRAVLLDYSAYAFAIALIAFVVMEQSSDWRMHILVEQFSARGIVPEGSRAGLVRARANMERRTGWWWVEALILVGAYAISHAWMRTGASIDGGTWFGRVVDGQLQLTLAGWWVMLVALPFYWFLLGRWLWRFITWGLMLRDISRCKLRLVATHPDRCGGLAFIGQYPRTYVLFVFAISTVVSATVLKGIVHAGVSLASFKFSLAGMVLFFAIAFVLPLMVFAPQLARLKREALSRYGTLVTRHNLHFEAKWIGTDGVPVSHDERTDELLGSADVSSLADLAAGYQLVQEMNPVPVTRQSVIPILIAALVPLVCVAATQVPFSEIMGTVKGLLLL